MNILMNNMNTIWWRIYQCYLVCDSASNDVYCIIAFNPLGPYDALLHHFASLKNDLFS